jgi:histone H3/H4
MPKYNTVTISSADVKMTLQRIFPRKLSTPTKGKKIKSMQHHRIPRKTIPDNSLGFLLLLLLFLVFPTDLIRRLLCKTLKVGQIDAGIVAYLAAVVQSITVKIMEDAGKEAEKHSRLCIAHHHIARAMNSDSELHDLLVLLIDFFEGELPCSYAVLLPEEKGEEEIQREREKKKWRKDEESEEKEAERMRTFDVNSSEEDEMERRRRKRNKKEQYVDPQEVVEESEEEDDEVGEGEEEGNNND